MITITSWISPKYGIVSTRWIAPILAAAVLTACDGENSNNSNNSNNTDICDTINGATFYTETLEEGGATQNGVAKMHWQIHFDNGMMDMMQSDFGMVANYRCDNNTVTAVMSDSSEVQLRFNDDHTALYFNPLNGEDKTYIRHDNVNSDYQACQRVRGNQYVDKAYADALTSGASSTSPTGQPSPELTLSFSDLNVSIFDYDAGTLGFYDCTFDHMHIHYSENDTSPMQVNVSADGDELEVTRTDKVLTLVKAPPGHACTQEFAPVCAVAPTNIVCVTAPCPVGEYKTFSNSCEAESVNASILFDGDCGEREGEYVYDAIPVCTDEDAPVCAAVSNTEPCLSLPCPNTTHKTFRNSCQAQAAGAPIIHERACGELEDSAVLSIPGICLALYAPVCGKDENNIVCVTEPCETHEYKTFGNSCEASHSLAPVVKPGECAKLQNHLAFSEPPANVISQQDFPTTQKTIRVVESKITGDILEVSLGYSGCGEQHFNLYIAQEFTEAIPLGAAYRFIPLTEDSCLAAFKTRLVYDLLPLRDWYEQAYQSTSGTISLGELGTYSF